MKLRAGEPWMPAKEYGHSLRGLTVNVVVRSIDAALVFQRDVLAARVIYADPDVAVCAGYGAEWMLHADHTYDSHPFGNALSAARSRGAGVELRLHGCDPDRAEAAARRLGFEVLAAAADKGHGLREVFLRDADGFTWVPDIPI
jgi:catechol 2,3-dioxygenase-like lactoylglutathione lyase family enzyme